MLAITSPSASNGAASAAALSSAAPPSSPVARIGFAKPPVVAVDLRRSSEVTPWVSPAIPPPAITAVVHLTSGGRSVMTAAVARVPAPIATGVAIASKALSMPGR